MNDYWWHGFNTGFAIGAAFGVALMLAFLWLIVRAGGEKRASHSTERKK